MSIGLKSYDIYLEDKFFKIVEKDGSLQTKQQALETLLKIETILKNNLSYLPSEKDQYSLMKPQAIYAILEDVSTYVYKKYQVEESSILSYFFRFSNVETVSFVYTRIINILYPPAVFSSINENDQTIELPTEVNLKICNYLDLKSLKNLAGVNRNAKFSARQEIHARAKLLGYKGDNSTESSAYLTDFEQELKDLHIEYMIKKIMKNVLPATGLAYDLKSFFTPCSDNSLLDEIEEKVNQLSRNQFISLCHLSYHYQLPKIRHIFPENLSLTEDDYPASESDIIKELFCSAIEFEDLNILKILLSFIKMPAFAIDDNHNNLIHIVTKYCNTEMLKLFLENGRNLINVKNLYGTTPLHYAVLGGCYEKVKLLLEYGAQANIQDDLFLTPLDIACNCFSKDFEYLKKTIVEILLEYNSNESLVKEE